MKQGLRFFSFLIIISLVFGAGFIGGVVTDHRLVWIGLGQNPSIQSGPDLSLIQDAWDAIQKYYVDRTAVQPQQLTYGAISGMINALGDTGHSRFLTPAEVKQEQNFTQGQFDGIGVEVEVKNGQIVILAPLDGSPALKAGLHSGDIILKVNGTDISGLALDSVVNKILGPPGTQVTLTIQSVGSSQTHDVTITRALIQTQNVTWQMVPGTKIADVRLSGFSNGVTKQLSSELQALQSQGAKGIILDMRNNPGGLLNESIGVASQFLSSGAVLKEKDAQGNISSTPVQPGGVATSIPMVVLINNNTASAAEIVAGALQDAGRSKLVGETTFGTGTVLNEFPLPDGSAMFLATEEWLTPKGRVIWHVGITPDDTVSMAADITPLVPETIQSLTLAQIQSNNDVQFVEALKMLQQIPGTTMASQ
ncbi:MAG: S41 family peptidase [Anaerolineaceae bacterium]|nr:S41 family peptidase [Anaerolineaceae bacterium]